jgi:hypothetical protein
MASTGFHLTLCSSKFVEVYKWRVNMSEQEIKEYVEHRLRILRAKIGATMFIIGFVAGVLYTLLLQRF